METGETHPTWRILHLEDDPNDAELVREMLEEEGIACSIERVATRPEFEEAIERGSWHVILSDHSLPAYDGLKALAVCREKIPHVPFVLFSGTIGEETAIESLKKGAADYILKQRPRRLIPAVRQAVQQAENHARRRAAEAELHKADEQRKQMEARFLRMQRMESIGSMVGGIAHDLNNALVPVLMGIGFLRTEQLGDQALQILNTMESSARRGAEMVKQVLAFARGAEGKESLVRMDLLMREMEKIISSVFPKSIRWRMKIAPSLWPVSGFATQLHQVLMNLCINARDAMPDGGQLSLASENVVLEETQARRFQDASAGSYVLIRVEDTGTGMPPEVLEKIFQPFFTTKDPERGTGLGLSTSLNIIKSHEGFIGVKSTPGQGTEFEIYLPAAKSALAAEAERLQASLPVGNGEWILLVDDESSICEITKATLENYNYHVLTATSGPEAVALFAEHRDKIQLAITDSAMPFMDGRATCMALRKIAPDLKIIAASGDADRDTKDDTAFRTKVAAFIQKPYTVDKLLTTVHRVLGSR